MHITSMELGDSVLKRFEHERENAFEGIYPNRYTLLIDCTKNPLVSILC